MYLKHLRHFLAVAAFFTLFIVVFFNDVVFKGKTFKATTMFAQALPSGPYGQSGNYGASCHTFLRESAAIEEPFYQFLRTSFQQGVFPLWNPYQCCGVPVAAMMEAGIFFPLTAIVYLLPNIISMDVLILARLLLAALLMYWLMSVWGFGLLARIAAALIFACSGPMVTLHIWAINVDLLLPLLFLSAYQFFHRGSLWDRLLLSIAVALSIFGGHIEHIFLVHFTLLCYGIFLLWQSKKGSPRSTFSLTARFVSFYLLGVGISAVALFPFIPDFFHSWTSHTADCGSAVAPLSEVLGKLITVIVPKFYSDVLIPLRGEVYNWCGGYLGVMAIALAVAGLWCRSHRPFILFSSIASFIVYGMVSGSGYTQWIGHLPVFNIMLLRLHSVWILTFFISFLAGAGIESIARQPQAMLRKFSCVTLSLGLLIGCYLLVFRREPFFAQAIKASGVAFGFLAASILWYVFAMTATRRKPYAIVVGLVVLLAGELFIHNPDSRPRRFDSFPRVPYIEFLKKNTQDPHFRAQGFFLAFYRNTAMAYGVESFSGSQALYPRRYVEFVQQLIHPGLFSTICPKPISTEGFDQALITRSDILALANVNYFVLPQQSNVGPQPVYDAETQILPISAAISLPSALPRAYLAYQWTPVPKGAGQEALEKIKAARLRAAANVIIENILDKDLPFAPSERQGIVAVEEKKRWANGVIVKARADAPCVLVLTDAYYPGWKAWVNGKPATIYPANHLFRAVFLPPGDHRVVFRFVPFWFYVGLGVTVFSCALWVGVAVGRLRHKRCPGRIT